MKRLLIILGLTTFLTGCAILGRPKETTDETAKVSWPVPAIKAYDKQFVGQLADELDATPPDSAVRVYSADHYTLRRQVCAINDSQTACQLMRQK